MTVHAQEISRPVFSSLSRIQRAILLVLEEEGRVKILDDPDGTGSRPVREESSPRTTKGRA